MVTRSFLAVLGACLFLSAASAQREFGFDNRKSSGQPYLTPAETVAKMTVPEGFEVKLFASEPMLVNPIAFTIDERGRVWAVESFEYPSKTPVGKMPRDRVVILEDTDGDGAADKKTVFAEGKDFPVRFDMASGIEVGHGGAFIGAAPYLFFVKDTDGDDKADKYEILLKGFGAQDTHETLNTFQWGPDGRLYGLHGIFTNSEVNGVKMNAAAWRYDVKAKKFEIFAEGTSNPWGMDWRNTDGQFIVACCVIPHLFHISPGGIYKRQAGASFNQHAYGLLPEICDHTFHKESGWAHAGLISLDTPLMPKEYQDDVIFGSIHGCTLKRNTLSKNGSTFKASKKPDFLVSGDKNVRPINLRWGPHGDIYLSDWHDQYPCHQTPADAWDYDRGRIYRIQKKGTKLGLAEDLGKKTTAELVKLLDDPNPYKWRHALRLLPAKLFPSKVDTTKPQEDWFAIGQSLKERQSKGDIRAMWVLNQAGSDAYLSQNLPGFKSAEIRRWGVRELSESLPADDPILGPSLAELAATEPSPEVRSALASAAVRQANNPGTLKLVHALMLRKEDAADPVIPFLTWLAYEKTLARIAQEAAKPDQPPVPFTVIGPASPPDELGWLAKNAPGNPFITDHIVGKAVRRLASDGNPKMLAACVRFIGELDDIGVQRKCLDGLILALGNRQFDAPAEWKATRAALAKTGDRDIQQMLSRLGIVFRDADALKRAVAVASDAGKPTADRADAIRDIAFALPAGAYEPLVKIALDAKSPSELRPEAIRALAGYDKPELAAKLLAAWKDLTPPLRSEVVTLLSGRKVWANALVAAMASKTVARTEVTDSAITRIRAFKDKTLDAQIEKVWGKFRDTPAELNTLIDRMRDQLDATPASFARGRKVFETNCGKCHQFDGVGHDVGPKLDGAERSVEYLLANVLDPNRVIGSPYFVRTVERKSGVIESGLLVEENDQGITLKGENAVVKMIPKKEIESVEVVEKSVMPEGLANNMTAQDFRDLMRYVMAHPFVTDVTVNDAKANVGLSGRVALPAAGKAKVVGKFKSPDAMKTRLVLAAPGRFAVAVNGKEAYTGTGKDGVAVDVELKAGENVVTVVVENAGKDGSAYLRLIDPDRKLRHADAE